MLRVYGLYLIAVGALAAVLVLSWYARRSDNWGATPEEIAATLPGDEWLDGGPPARVWPSPSCAVWIRTATAG